MKQLPKEYEARMRKLLGEDFDKYLNELGIMVLRYPNSDIHDYFDEVCLDILRHINMRSKR